MTYSDNHYMRKKFAAVFLLIPLLSLTACFSSGDPQAPASPAAPASPTQQVAPQNQATSPSIDSQMQDLRQHNGTINPQDQQKLNNNPLVPGAFKQ
jgi:hypothetical protein